MITAIITLIFLALPPAHDDPEVEAPTPKEQHFCCAETYNDDKKRGIDCETIGSDAVKSCRIGGGAVLFCSGDWDQDTSGTVTCG